MYQPSFGTKGQIQFQQESDYYEFLGYLSKSDGSTRLVWEKNDDQGAWTSEGRIQFYSEPPSTLKAILSRTNGNGGILFRVNCNEFTEDLVANHSFVYGTTQNMATVRGTVPAKFQVDFDRGFNL